ncbi:MAG TPA: hypothetical protein VFA47_04430 [Candidatus Manganitrophaceae bacterium]|nr:hypothetical protein [Candidatus Manganitrophaceae bacterium]
MRSHFYLILGLACALIFSGREAGGDPFGRDGNLEIWVRTNKPVYDFGEPIVVILKLKNAASLPLIVNRRFDPFNDLQWEIFFDPAGFVPVRPAPPKPPGADDYVVLKPGESIEKEIPDLAEIVDGRLKKGLYGLRLTYINKEKPKGPETWTGEIITNRLSFSIKSGNKT